MIGFLLVRLIARDADFFAALAGLFDTFVLLAGFFSATGALRVDGDFATFLAAGFVDATDFLAMGLRVGVFRVVCLLATAALVVLFATAFFAGAFLLATFFASVRVVFDAFATFFAAMFFCAAGVFAIVLRAAGFLLTTFFAAFALALFAGAAFFTTDFFAVVFFFALEVVFLVVFFVAMMSPRKGYAGAPSWRPYRYAWQPNRALVCVAARDDTLALDSR